MKVTIRSFRTSDTLLLRNVFQSAIRITASAYYNDRQIQVWSSRCLDEVRWTARIEAMRPFVAELEGQIAGYAGLLPSGYLDHFYVDGRVGGRGVGTALMHHVLAVAAADGLTELTSDVSLAAQPFFTRFGFVIVEQRWPVIEGIAFSNARMRLCLVTQQSAAIKAETRPTA